MFHVFSICLYTTSILFLYEPDINSAYDPFKPLHSTSFRPRVQLAASSPHPPCSVLMGCQIREVLRVQDLGKLQHASRGRRRHWIAACRETWLLILKAWLRPHMYSSTNHSMLASSTKPSISDLKPSPKLGACAWKLECHATPH